MKKLLSFLFAFLLVFTMVACEADSTQSVADSEESIENESSENKEEAMQPIYPEKENVVLDKQYFSGSGISFPDYLWQTPESERASEYDRPEYGAEGYFIKSVPYNDEATNVFVYVGLPKDASAEAPVPGVILVHGGGGTAFPDWVKMWTERGYAAISVDTEGRVPTKDASATVVDVAQTSPKHHGPTNPQFADSHMPVESQWMYHAVSATIAAHSFLKSFEQVDSAKIGITGISWGSVVVSNTVCYDDRLAFCAPVYGGMAMEGTTGICGQVFNRYPKGATLWNDVNFLANCRTPLLFVNWNEDDYFAIDATSRCASTAPYGNMVLIDKLYHGHLPAMKVKEIFTFADNICKGSEACLPQIEVYPSFDFKLVILNTKRSDVTYGYLYTTSDSVISKNTAWESSLVLVEKGKITFELGDNVKAFYITVTDSLGVSSTTPVAFAE